MENEKVYAMSTGRVIPCLVAKAERKGRTRQEVYAIICWLTGYSEKELENRISPNVTCKQFFDEAPNINPNCEKITGSICGVKIQEIEDPLMKKIRYLDKMVDELAKGKDLERILRK